MWFDFKKNVFFKNNLLPTTTFKVANFLQTKICNKTDTKKTKHLK